VATIEADDGLSHRSAQRSISWYTFGIANLVIIVILSLAFWWFLADPKWSPFHLYPQPITAALFWAILVTVFVGFNLEFAGFGKLRQPVKGIAAILVICVIAVAFMLAIAYGWGHFDPAFAASRAGGLGYQTGSLFVLFGFLIYVMAVINWGHWPWSSLKISQPWVGIGDIALMTIPTFLLFAFFVLPDLGSFARPGRDIMNVNTAIGFFYSIVVAVLITGLLMENWPWRLAGPGGRTALAATVGNLALGTVLYFALLAIAKAIIGSQDVTALGPAVGSMAAQLGVCWAFWMILWSNAFGNAPIGMSAVARYAARFIITLALGIGTFVLYFYVLAGSVLHEPPLVGSLHGNALGFIDWMVMFTLFYVVCLGSVGLPRPAAATVAPENAG
jgi:amino acid transporter, AAT family